MLVTR